MQENTIPKTGDLQPQSEDNGQLWSGRSIFMPSDLAGMLSTAADISAQINAALDIEVIFETIIPMLKESFGLYNVFIFLLDEDCQQLHLRAGSGDASRTLIQEHYSIPVNHPHSLVAKAAQQQQPVVVHDVSESEDYLACAILPDIVSEVTLPMIAGGNCIGVFDIQLEGDNRFTEEIIHVFY